MPSMPTLYPSIPRHLKAIDTLIKQEASLWPGTAQTIDIIAVSKQQPVEKILAAIDAGHKIFGENRVQEASLKWPSIKKNHNGITLHLIGPLQTNKVKEALMLFDTIETVDRPELAEQIAKHMPRLSARDQLTCHSFFIQVNVGGEPQKSGILPHQADDFIKFCKALQLPITGLMCIPPQNEAPAPYFALLATLAKRHHLPFLSMGMSHDYKIAVSLGATHVRIGTAIFGERMDSGAREKGLGTRD